MFDRAPKGKQMAFKSISSMRSEEGSCRIDPQKLDQNISYYIKIYLNLRFRDPTKPSLIVQDGYQAHLRPPFKKDSHGNDIKSERRIKEYLCVQIRSVNGYYNISFHQEPLTFKNNLDSIVQNLEDTGMIW